MWRAPFGRLSPISASFFGKIGEINCEICVSDLVLVLIR